MEAVKSARRSGGLARHEQRQGLLASSYSPTPPTPPPIAGHPPVGVDRFHFEQKVPIPPYLLALAVGHLESRDIGPRSRVWSEVRAVGWANPAHPSPPSTVAAVMTLKKYL